MFYFPEPRGHGKKTKIASDLSNYATKSDYKEVTNIGKSKFAKTTADLAILQSDVNRMDIGKLETTPVDLSKLSNVVKSDAVEKSEYNELVRKVNATDSTKQNLEKYIEDVAKKLPNTSKFVETYEFNRLIEINFDARTAESLKKLVIK